MLVMTSGSKAILDRKQPILDQFTMLLCLKVSDVRMYIPSLIYIFNFQMDLALPIH